MPGRASIFIPASSCELDRRVGYRTESQNPGCGAALRAYLVEDLQPAFARLDFTTRLIESPTGKGPYLLADYHEDASLPTVLTYGHGDVVDGMAGEWRDNLDPWQTTIRASGSMAAAPPTIRASTASTCRRSRGA